MIGIVNNRLRNELRSRKVRERFVQDRKRTLAQRLPENPEAALEAVDYGFVDEIL